LHSSDGEEPASYVRVAALINAARHGGKASPSAVLGRVLAEHPELRKSAGSLAGIVLKVVSEVNSMGQEAQLELLKKLRPELLAEREEVKKEKRLPPLPNVDRYGKVVTRFAPNPDSVLHLGSTRAIILSHDYARMYSGKFILRFEDTDPRLKRSALQLYDYILEDLDWLRCRPDEVFYQSDRLPIYYQYAEKLIMMGGAFVCTCRPATFRKVVMAKKPCPCRPLPVSVHVTRWRKMLSGEFDEGEAVLRVKTDLNHPNPAVRDWPAMRIIDTFKHRHPRVGSKYRVWPLYNWSAGIDDHMMGISHIIRGQEHAVNAVRQKYFYSAFGWSYPEAIHYGRLSIEGAELSKSKVERGIREGRYNGYDDPRLATLRSLRRRGIDPEAIRRLIIEIGPKPVDVEVSWDNLLAYNRQIIDRTSPRHLAVFDEVILRISGVPDHIVTTELPAHPSEPSMGKRRFEIRAREGRITVLAPREELRKGRRIRLIGLMNVQIMSVGRRATGRFISFSLDEARKMKADALQWVPTDKNVRISVIMPDATSKNGFSDEYLKNESVGTVVQFERQFFARLDSFGEDRAVLYYTSR
jgi:glutamyl-tRNA synthetase